MKRNLLRAALAASVLLPSLVHAAAFYDGFNYVAGQPLSNAVTATPTGQTAPNGNAWASAGAITPTITIGATSLTAPAGLPASTGGSVVVPKSGTAGQAPSSRVGVGNFTSGTVYWSILFHADDTNNLITGTTGAFVGGFNPSTGAPTGGVSNAAARIVLRRATNNANAFNFGTSVNSPTGGAGNPQVFDATDRPAGQTYLLVGSYTFNPGANDDVATLWVDPAAGTLGTANAPAPLLTSTGADLTSIQSFFLRQNTNAPDSFTVDELRVDTTWAGVTSNAVPEPTTLASIGLGAIALLRRRRRA